MTARADGGSSRGGRGSDVTASGSGGAGGLVPELLVRIDAVCEAFEAACAADPSSSPDLGAYLTGYDGHERRYLFGYLLALDVEHRDQRGESPTAEDYVSRFPDLSDVIRSHDVFRDPSTRSVQGRASRSRRSAVLDAWLERLTDLDRARHEVLEPIDRDGTGEVLRVRDLDIGRDLAMKVPPRGSGDGEASADDASARRRFLDEAWVTARLEHPGVVPVHHVGVDDQGVAFFTMRLVAGQDLNEAFARVASAKDPTWNRTRALGILLRVAEATAFAHERGVVHGALSPANVRVGEFGEVHVMGWGLADLVDHEASPDLLPRPADPPPGSSPEVGEASSRVAAEQEGRVASAYLAPEQAGGRTECIGAHTDVYAVGAMLRHLLTGRAPYLRVGEAPSVGDLLLRVLRGPPEALAVVAPGSPEELVAICERAMARRIEDRYEDMRALARDLRASLEQRVVAAYRTGPIAELKKWIARNRALAATAAAALVATVVMSGWAWSERSRALQNERTALDATDRAERSQALASRRGAEAARERASLLQLSDARRLSGLEARMGDLWPAAPETVDAMDRWLAEARALLETLPAHVEQLAALRERGTSLGLPPPDPVLAETEAYLEQLRTHRARHDGPDPQDGLDAEARADHIRQDDATIALAEAGLRAEIAADAIRRERAREYGFDDPDDQWWHDDLRDLVARLSGFQEADPYGSTFANIAARREFAIGITERTVTGVAAARAWEEAREAIRAHPEYGGLDLSPQLGLLPLGPDPRSTLWEFLHVQSGAPPERDATSGRWTITGATGIVLVLIPGGTFWMGAQGTDEAGPNFDPLAEPDESTSDGRPVEVTLAPYFLSKYELTQGQWETLTGELPSNWGPGTPVPDSRYPVITRAHPLESVPSSILWSRLPDFGLRLPTEAQWERAARGGNDFPWWTGRDRAALDEAGNLADSTGAGGVFPPSWPFEGELHDGFAFYAPVGVFAPNPFGLHDVIGNVSECCADGFSKTAYDGTPAPGDGRWSREAGSLESRRGGAWTLLATQARSAKRSSALADVGSYDAGVRPAREVVFP